MKSPALALAFAALSLLVGCGRRPEPGVPSGDTGPVTVRLAYFPNVTHGVALVGAGRGLFAAALGRDTTIEEQAFNAGPAEIEALFADQVDIGYIGPGPALNGFLKSKGRALIIIAGAASGGTALVVRTDSGIADVKGLAGKRVAVPQTGGTQDISLRHALRSAGLASSDKGGSVTVLPTPNPDTLTLFKKGEVDAAWVPEPWVARLVKEGRGRVLVDERSLWANGRFATTVVVVRRKFMEQHPAIVAKFLDAHIQAVTWIRANPAEARTVIGGQIKKETSKAIPDDILKESLGRTELTYDPLRETVLTFADWARALGYQKDDRSALNGLFDLRALNDALARAKEPVVQ